jgi:hypothetical protein
MSFWLVALLWFGQVPDVMPTRLPLDVEPAAMTGLEPPTKEVTVGSARVAIIRAAHADLVTIDAGEGAVLAPELDLDSFLVNTAKYEVDGVGRRLRERLRKGTLADGTAAIVARVDVAIALYPCCGEPRRVLARWRETHVVVCSVSAPVRCADPVLVRCPRRGCGDVRLRAGQLTITGRRGHRHRTMIVR